MKNVVTLILCAAVYGSADAFEIGTHALISKVSADQSVLSISHPTSIVPVLGFERLDPKTPFLAIFQGVPENLYLDNETPSDPLMASLASFDYLRRPQPEERRIFSGLMKRGFVQASIVGDFELSTVAWLMRGAIREDDNDIGVYSLGDRDEDPWGNRFRAPSHFYDPINHRAYDFEFQCLFFA